MQTMQRHRSRLGKIYRDKYPWLVRWFKEKYNLPITDPRFKDADMAGILDDFALHVLFEDDKTRPEVDEEEAKMLEQLETGDLDWNEYAEEMTKQIQGAFHE